MDRLSHLLQNHGAREVYAITWQRLFTPASSSRRDSWPRSTASQSASSTISTTAPAGREANNCYLQDLFADPRSRGNGVGAALIEAVRQEAARRGVTNVYWMTHETNATARKLYDRVARRTGFIEYDLVPG